jgi:predicted nucleic acid-binding Zn ribbon protein
MMPTYLYLCEVNKEEFEEFHDMSEVIEECPICKAKGLPSHAPKRLINCVSVGVVELTGQELINKLKEDGRKIKEESHKNANVYANLLGENKYHELQTKLDRRDR